MRGKFLSSMDAEFNAVQGEPLLCHTRWTIFSEKPTSMNITDIKVTGRIKSL